MDALISLFSPPTVDLFRNLFELASLPPGRLLPAILLISGIVLLNDLVRTALMIEFTRSALAHVVVNVMTLLPAVLVAAILFYSAWQYPQRAWGNLWFACLFFVVWYAGGALTRLARPDTEGADIGFMTVGALITFPCGILAALVF